MSSRGRTVEQKAAKKEYQRKYRANASAEKKKEWSESAQVRTTVGKNKGDERAASESARKRLVSKRNLEQRVKRKLDTSDIAVLPSTPNSKVKLINHIIDSASPNTSKVLSTHQLNKSEERKARAAIVQGTAQLVKSDRSAKKQLITLFSKTSCNKRLVCKNLGLSSSSFYYKSTKGVSPCISKTTLERVLSFYQQQDVVTLYPNKTKSGETLKVMKFTIRRTHAMFREEYPNDKVGLTTFGKLRPKSVKLMKAGKWFQCLCDICDNIKMICRAIRISMVRSSMAPPDILNTGNELDLAKSVVCSIHSRSCLDRQCFRCSSPYDLLKSLFNTWMVDDVHIPIAYSKWMRAEEAVGERTVTKLRKCTLSVYRWQLFQELSEQLKSFPLHILNAVSQASAYSKCKKSLRPNELVCVVDFAENYSCRPYGEAQSAYYVRNSVTIHPMVAIFASGGNVLRDSVVMISPDLKHDGSAVQSFVQVFMEHVKIHYPHINHLIFWSDGCAAQYKSRVPLSNLRSSFGSSNFEISWNYFGSRHGKGESDGESAVVKNFLDNSVKAEQLTIQDSQGVFDLLKHSDRCIVDGKSRRHFYFVDSSSINKLRSSVDVAAIPAVPQVRKIHHVIVRNGDLWHKRSSCYCVGLDSDACWHVQEPDYTVFNGLQGRKGERFIPVEEESENEMGESESEEESSAGEEENVEAEPGSTIADESGVDILEYIRSNPDIFSADSESEDDAPDCFDEWHLFESPMDEEL